MTENGVFPFRNAPAMKRAKINIPDNLHESTSVSRKKLARDRKVREAKKKEDARDAIIIILVFLLLKRNVKDLNLLK